jgi:sulfite exporter TauE/SafE
MHHMIPVSGDLGLLFLAAMLGGVHCAGMCGPYVAVCSARISAPGPRSGGRGTGLRLLFNFARLGTYVVLGTLAGAFGQIAGAAGKAQGFPGAVSLVAGLLAMVSALSLAGILPSLEQAAARLGLDRFLRAGTMEAMRAPRHVSALLLGGLQGLLPCALVYGAVSRAAASASASMGALTMLVFGLGTLPALLALTFAGATLPAWTRSRRVSAVLVGTVGVLLVLRGLAAWGVVPHTRLW